MNFTYEYLINNIFDGKDYSPSPLFGPLEKIFVYKPFIPFWEAIEREFLKSSEQILSYFEHASLTEWRSSFLGTVSSIWTNTVNSVLNALKPSSMSISAYFSDGMADALILDGSLFKALSAEYPVLTEQLLKFMDNSIRHMEESLQAIIKYDREIRQFFPDRTAPFSKVKNISCDISDRHNNGQTVHVISYSDGNKVVYKPRTADIDHAFNSWLDFLCEKAGIPLFPHVRSFNIYRDFSADKDEDPLMPRFPDRPSGSFWEFISYTEAKDEAEIADYFFREGFLTGAMYALYGNDIHSENIIYHDGFPMLIDSETVICPENKYDMLRDRPLYDVVSMGILPFLTAAPGLHTGNDALTSDFENSFNLPLLNGKKISGRAYKEEFKEGFKKAFSVCIHEPKLCCLTVCRLFNGSEIRIILRTTNIYNQLTKILGNKKYSKSIEAYREGIRAITKKFDDCPDKQLVEQISEKETAALFVLDFPHFVHTISPEDFSSLRKRIYSMSEDVLQNELEKIDFILSGYHAYGHVSYASEKDIKKIAERVSFSLKADRCTVTHRPERTLILASPVITMLEGKLGAAVGLAAYLKTVHDEDAEEALKSFISQISYPEYVWGPGLSPYEPGLSEGMGGFILGMTLLYEMGWIEKSILLKITDRLSGLNYTNLHFSEKNALYGEKGLYLALKRLPAEIRKINPFISELENNILESLNRRQIAADSDLSAIIKEELLENIISLSVIPSGCVCDPVIHIGEDFLENFPAPGFFFGESGTLYALSKLLKPAAVPAVDAIVSVDAAAAVDAIPAVDAVAF